MVHLCGWYCAGNSLFGFPDGRTGYLRRDLAQREARWRAALDQSPAAILATALTMNGFPYLWAGMSPKGMDCSGYVRTVLFMHDIIIPRDAGPQSKTGERISLETYTLYPKMDTVSIRYREREPKRFKLKLRIPSWSAATSVSVKSVPRMAKSTPCARAVSPARLP